jgi:hypothetical protein
MTSINSIAANEHRADLHRAAQQWRRGSTSEPSRRLANAQRATVALRLADSDEAPVVRRLAALDDAPTLEGPTLLALIDGEAVAALSLQDGRVVANPFVLTQDAVGLLRLRAKHLRGASRRRRWRVVLRPRFA